MSYDYLTLSAVTGELQATLAGARVQRIYEIGKNEIVLQLFHRGEVKALLLSCHANHARVHLTSYRYTHLDKPSPFCMLLRKYLLGGRIREFRQLYLERVLEIYFDPPEAMQPVKLVVEIMGRRSNLLLVDQKEVIIGAIKTATTEQNPRRAVQSGVAYQPVPPQNKLNPLSLRPEELLYEMERFLLNKTGTPEQALIQAVMGLSPLAARELLFRGGWDIDTPLLSANRLAAEIRTIFEDIARGKYKPVLAENQGLYAAYPLTHLPNSENQPYNSVNELLDAHYHRIIVLESSRRLRETLTTSVVNQLNKLDRKLQEQSKELTESENAPLYRLYGETLLTYGGQAPRGVSTVMLPHLYRQEETLTIPMNPMLSVNENSRHYFHRYRKATKAREMITKRIGLTEEEISYCQNLLFSIDHADNQSLAEIRRELTEAGYIRDKKKISTKKDQLPQPLSFKTSSGRTVLVGLNNRQNDYITFKVAARRDIWLHIREVPGSHVLLKDAPYPPPEDDLTEAALLAAFFSRARQSSAAAVDYTQIRHVRRGPGAKPGFVLYENFSTITVNPLDERLKKILEACPLNKD